jgi:2-iminobutanoate/2-iminopropanoate deaminase
MLGLVITLCQSACRWDVKKEVIHTARAAVTGAPLVQAVKLGNLVFCSGASPRDPLQGNKVVEGGFTAQATQALANLKAVLEAAGSGFEHCLKATCFILDVDENLPLLNEVWVQHFGKNLPARTVVGVAKLRENYLLEVEVTAYVPGSAPNGLCVSGCSSLERTLQRELSLEWPC